MSSSPISSSSSSQISASSSNRRAPCWKFFDLVDGDITKAKCRLCGVIRSRGKVAEESLLGCKSLADHLRRSHVEEAKEIDESLAIKKRQQEQCKKRKLEEAGIAEAFAKSTKWAADSEAAIKVTKSIGEMICLDNEAFRIVERRGFLRFVSKAYPRYEIPSRHYFSDTVVPKIWEGVEKELKNSPLFHPNMYYGLTSDIWTSKGHDGYVLLNSFCTCIMYYVIVT